VRSRPQHAQGEAIQPRFTVYDFLSVNNVSTRTSMLGKTAVSISVEHRAANFIWALCEPLLSSGARFASHRVRERQRPSFFFRIGPIFNHSSNLSPVCWGWDCCHKPGSRKQAMYSNSITWRERQHVAPTGCGCPPLFNRQPCEARDRNLRRENGG
jgi:hypothetical protein